MCSFDYHLRRAKKRYEDDILWMVAYYYSAMKDLCNQYPVWDKEDMLGYLIACFWVDLIKLLYEYGGDHMPKLKQSDYDMKVRLFQATVAKQLII